MKKKNIIKPQKPDKGKKKADDDEGSKKKAKATKTIVEDGVEYDVSQPWHMPNAVVTNTSAFVHTDAETLQAFLERRKTDPGHGLMGPPSWPQAW